MLNDLFPIGFHLMCLMWESSRSSWACRLHCCWTGHPDWLMWCMRASVMVSSISCTAEVLCRGSMVPVQKEKEPERGGTQKGSFYIWWLMYIWGQSVAHSVITSSSGSCSCVINVISLVLTQFLIRKYLQIRGSRLTCVLLSRQQLPFLEHSVWPNVSTPLSGIHPLDREENKNKPMNKRREVLSGLCCHCPFPGTCSFSEDASQGKSGLNCKPNANVRGGGGLVLPHPSWEGWSLWDTQTPQSWVWACGSGTRWPAACRRSRPCPPHSSPRSWREEGKKTGCLGVRFSNSSFSPVWHLRGRKKRRSVTVKLSKKWITAALYRSARSNSDGRMDNVWWFESQDKLWYHGAKGNLSTVTRGVLVIMSNWWAHSHGDRVLEITLCNARLNQMGPSGTPDGESSVCLHLLSLSLSGGCCGLSSCLLCTWEGNGGKRLFLQRRKQPCLPASLCVSLSLCPLASFPVTPPPPPLFPSFLALRLWLSLCPGCQLSTVMTSE